jgi:hypothetical protein
MDASIKARQDIERAVVRKLIRELKKRGFHVNQVGGGDEDEVTVRTEKEIMDEVFALDMARLYFKEEDAGSVLLVMGNDGWDVISDWSFTEGSEFAKAMDEITEKIWKEYEEND